MVTRKTVPYQGQRVGNTASAQNPEGTYIWSTRRGRDKAGKEAAAGSGHASLGKCPSHHTVVSGPKPEFNDIAGGRGDAAGTEGETIPADGDRNGGGAGLEGQADQKEEAGKHGVGVETLSGAEGANILLDDCDYD